MCTGGSPSAPSLDPLPPPRPLASPQQAPAAVPLPPPPTIAPVKTPPPAPIVNAPTPPPPPQLATTGDELAPTVKKKKSARKAQQQATSGIDSLRIDLNTGSDSEKSRTAGLNIQN